MGEYLGSFLAVAGLFLFQMEPDFSFSGLRRGHEPFDRIQNGKNLLVMDGKFSLQVSQF